MVDIEAHKEEIKNHNLVTSLKYQKQIVNIVPDCQIKM